MKYRISYTYPFYYVEKGITIGWWFWEKTFWSAVDDGFWNLEGAERLYKELTDNNIH